MREHLVRAAVRVAVVTLLVALAVNAGVAHAWRESAGLPWAANLPVDDLDCDACHRGDVPVIFAEPFGPHGGYSSASDKCSVCHVVHEAAGSFRLTLYSTYFDVCNSCHDLSFASTGGRGVYGAIRARGVSVTARHNVQGYNETESGYEATTVVPGGSEDLADKLSCGSCHTPHGNTVIPPFLGERVRFHITSPPPQPSTKILQDDVGGVLKGTYTVYGADWCAACHDRRHSGAKDAFGLNNHPVDQTNRPYADPTFSPEATDWMTMIPPSGDLPTRQAGYSREATPGWAPMCQQCHEDLRDVERGRQWTAWGDGATASDNPRWQTFPHESPADSFVLETGDDLCMNCHPTRLLP